MKQLTVHYCGWGEDWPLALHALLFRMAQDGRTYALLFLLFSCALLAAWRLAQAAQRGQGGIGAILALGLCQGGMLWLHTPPALPTWR